MAARGGPGRFTLLQMEYFCLVAELGSFAAAATAQGVTANAVSAAVGTLETSIGSRLCIRRRSRGIELTAEGRAFYLQAKDLLARADDVSRTWEGVGEPPSTTFALGAVPPLAPTLLARMGEELLRRHPDARLRLVVDSQESLVAMLREEELDCAFVYDAALPGELEKQELFRRTPQVLVGLQHRLAGRRAVDLAELAGERLFVLESTPTTDYSVRLLERFGVMPKDVLEVTDAGLLHALIGRGLGYGITVLDDYRHLAGRLVGIPIVPSRHDEAIVAAWRSGRSHRDEVSTLVTLAIRDAARPRSG